MNWERTLLSLAAAAILILSACAKQAEDSEGEQAVVATVDVQTATVQQGMIRQIIPASGTLAALPDRDVKVSPLVPGRIDELLVVEGDAVAQGQVIARLDDSTLSDQLSQAKAALENARASEERISRLYDRGIAAGKEKGDAHRDSVTAEAAYDTAKTQVERAQVHSPIAGIVVKRFVSVGEQVDGTGNQPIVEIANFDPIELIASLPTSYLASVRAEQQAEAHTDAFRDKVFAGNVVAVLPAVDPASGSATVRIRIPNKDHLLKGGMFATAGILTASHPDALYVPAAALVATNNEPKVFVVGTDSKVQEKPVQVGWRDGDRIEILRGVTRGEVLVTTGSYGLADGMKVTVKK